jgi:hypothetical protein
MIYLTKVKETSSRAASGPIIRERSFRGTFKEIPKRRKI